MANFGIGLGAFADGFARGYGIRRQIKRDKREEDALARKEKKQTTMDNAWDTARKGYDTAIADDVLTQAGKQGSGAFDVDGAKEKATEKIGSMTDYVYKHQLPKIIDAAMSVGDIAGAEALQKWGNDKKERKQVELFGSALNDFYAGQSSGDYSAFADKSMKLLNNAGASGLKATGYDFLKDGEGRTAGITFQLEQDGKTRDVTFDSMQGVAEWLSGEMSPQNAAKRYAAQVESAEKFKSQIALKQAEAQIGLGKDVSLERERQSGRESLEDAKQQNRMWLEAAKSKQSGSKVQQDFEQTRAILVNAGFTEEEIKPLIPSMLKITSSEYRKGRSPEELRQTLMMELSKDYFWSRKPPHEISARIDELMKIATQLSDSEKQAPIGITGIGR